MSDVKGLVLVVDDNDDSRSLMLRRLERKGYDVVEAKDARQGLQVIQSQEIDVVLLDQMMPGICGLEALKLVRQKFSAAELPVIMVTGRQDRGNILEAMNLGASDYVTKPVNFQKLLEQIEVQLARKEAEGVPLTTP